MTQRTRIQNAIITAAKAGRFFAVQYEPASGEALDIDPALAPRIAPATAFANEIGSSFRVDENFGRHRRLSRESWNFRLEVAFSQEVTAEFFEFDLCNNPIVLVRDSDEGLDQAVLQLSRTVATHPVQHSSGAGSRFAFDFTIWLGRI